MVTDAPLRFEDLPEEAQEELSGELSGVFNRARTSHPTWTEDTCWDAAEKIVAARWVRRNRIATIGEVLEVFDDRIY